MAPPLTQIGSGAPAPVSRTSESKVDVSIFAAQPTLPVSETAWTPVSLQRAVNTLQRIPLFATMPVEQLARLAPAISTHHTARDDWLIQQGQRDPALFVLVRGRAHLLRISASGREVLLDILKPGAHAGEMCLIDNQPHSSSVRCIEGCDWLRIESASLAACLGSDPRLSYALMHGLVQRLRRAHRQITSLALSDVRDRVLECLVEFSEPLDNGQRLVRAHLKRQDLARLTGASREMISRVLQKLEGERLIDLQSDGGIVVRGAPPSMAR
jgi:CRP/FNR family transcriptional regulator, cyclic AMP receptor protein